MSMKTKIKAWFRRNKYKIQTGVSAAFTGLGIGLIISIFLTMWAAQIQILAEIRDKL